MLESFGPDIWIADGPVVSAIAGFHYPTRMAVIRLKDGTLVIWSPVTPSPELFDAIDALGTVGHILAPNALHHLALPDWHLRYPTALIHPAPGLAEKRTDLAFSSDLGDAPHLAWAGEIDQVVVPNSIADEVVFFHKASGTVIFTDLLQNMPRGWYNGWRSIVARLDLMTGTTPRVPRKFRMALRARKAAEPISRVLDWPAERVLMAHGTPVTNDAQSYLRGAFGWLVK
jgi:hypothetical protein